MSCVNPNDPEFKRLLAITGNPLLAEIEFNKRENTTSVKPGVSELFESNPELANAVYEALGFRQKVNPDVSINELEDTDISKEIDILYKGESIGKATLVKSENSDDADYIENWSIKSEYQNKGLGYSARQILQNKYPTLKLSSAATDKSKYLYEKAVKNQITSQQKQQALQQYSQYLDTIFPDSKVKDIVYHGSHTKFDKFDKSLSGSKTRANINGKGFFFSNSKAIAQGYTQSLDKSNIYNDLILYWYFKRDLGNKNINNISEKEWLDMIINYFGNDELTPQYLQKQTFEKTKALFEKFKDDEDLNNVQYTDEIDASKYIQDTSVVYPVILDIIDPLVVEGNNRQMLTIVKKETESLKETNDGIVFNNVEDGMSNGARFVANTYTVFESEQIHILGGKQDIEGFKKFVEKTSAPAETVKVNSTIFEQNPNITEEEIKVIYENYSNLMNRVRADKQVSYDVFRLLLNTYQVVKYKDTYIFGSYHRNTATFISRMNSSPSSKELLAEAIPNIVKQGIDVMSFIPKDYADKLTRSGYTVSKKGFRHNFKGEDMIKYAATSNPQVFEKIFKKPFDQISGEELEAFNEDVPLVYIATEIDSKYIQKAGKDVTKILETYLSQFGILSKDISEIKDKLNIDEFGFVDLLNKIVYTKDKKNLPELAGQFIAYMMQYNPLVQDIVKTLIKTEALPLPKGSYTITESGDIKYDYKNIDKTPYFKYIGKLIAESLQNKVKGEYKNSLIDKIEELIKTFFNYITKKDLHRININIGIITDNIMQQNKKLITSSLSKPGAPNKPTQQVSVESALKKDKFGADIIYELAKKGFILTGSTAISEQGTILRPDENPLHDIDWVSPFNRAETVALFLDSYPDALKVRDIVNNEYVTDSFLITPANYHIGNYETVTYDEKIIIKQYDVLDSNNQVAGTYRLVKNIKTKGNDEVVTGVEAKVIDFFSYEDYALRNKYEPYSYESKQGTVIKLANWKDIFQAKLDFARYKDIWDYNRFIPNEYKTSLNEELAVYLANELKNQLDINVPLKQPNMLDILSTAKVVTQEDIDNKKLEC